MQKPKQNTHFQVLLLLYTNTISFFSPSINGYTVCGTKWCLHRITSYVLEATVPIASLRLRGSRTASGRVDAVDCRRPSPWQRRVNGQSSRSLAACFFSLIRSDNNCLVGRDAHAPSSTFGFLLPLPCF
jgi:hypothetical protein